MRCNQITKPEIFDEAQKEQCRKCNLISKKKTWCCKFGYWIDGRVKIIKPSRRILQPSKRVRKPTRRASAPSQQVSDAEYAGFMANNGNRFRQNYKVALTFYEQSKEEIIDENTFVKRRQACAVCPPEDKGGCGCAGCKQWQKLVLKSLKCSLNKW